jgi:endonuclease YncB( thermonuclease family)
VLDSASAQHKLRFAGADSPEKRQPFYQVSGDSLARRIFQRHVEARCYKVDRWNATCAAYMKASATVALGQVRAGMAWHAKPYEHEQTSQE